VTFLACDAGCSITTSCITSSSSSSSSSSADYLALSLICDRKISVKSIVLIVGLLVSLYFGYIFYS